MRTTERKVTGRYSQYLQIVSVLNARCCVVECHVKVSEKVNAPSPSFGVDGELSPDSECGVPTSERGGCLIVTPGSADSCVDIV